MSTSDPFPDLEPFPEGLDSWEQDHTDGALPQARKKTGVSHVALPRPNTSEIAGGEDLPGEATPSTTERQYFWSGDSLWTRDGDPLGAGELSSRLSETATDVNRSGGTVEFDIFPGQTGGDYGSRAVVAGERITDYLIALPAVDLSSRNTSATFLQLRHFLKDVPLLAPGNTATIRADVPYLYYGRESNPTVPSGALAGLVEDLVGAYVNESTADTLDQYSGTY